MNRMFQLVFCLFIVGAIGTLTSSCDHQGGEPDTLEDMRKVADKCVELDPTTRDWVQYMVGGRARCVGLKSVDADGLKSGFRSLSAEWMNIEIQKENGRVETNEYVISYHLVDRDNTVVSNFNSKAELSVMELLSLAERHLGMVNEY